MLFFDENLSWKPHIANIANKVSKSIGIIYKASLCLPTSTLCTLYYSLVYLYLLYCITVWGSSYPSTLKRIVLLQTKVVRIIPRSTFNAQTVLIFKQLKILNLYDIYRFQTRKIIFLFKIGRFPDALKRLFRLRLAIIAITPDNAVPFTYPLAEQISNSLRYVCKDLNFFNSLKIKIQNVGTISLLKSELRTLLLS